SCLILRFFLRLLCCVPPGPWLLLPRSAPPVRCAAARLRPMKRRQHVRLDLRLLPRSRQA
ncbi:MAG TPA: hypothetical protein VGG30_03100, partial [Pirellulales bacterium]